MTIERTGAIRSLAASVRAGKTLREALATWDADVPEIESVSRRLRLGLSPATSLEAARPFFEDDLDALILVIELRGRAGGDPALMLEAVARSIDERVAAGERARVNAAGAKLSARMVAGLPLAALLLLPGSGAPLLDLMGLLVIVAGIGLCFGGMRWIGKLLPTPPERVDEAGLLAAIAAGALRSGCTLSRVLDLAAGLSDHEGLSRAGRHHRLGMTWPEALGRLDDDGFRALGSAIAAPQRTGVPVAEALDAFVERRSQELERDLERAIKRAPVKMVVPLTLCVLPSFGLLALTPFLRSLAPT